MEEKPRNADEQAFWDNAFVSILAALVDIDSLRVDPDEVVHISSVMASKALDDRRKKAIT